MPRARRRAQFLLLALSTSFGLIVLECGGQLASGTPVSQRVLLFSESPWVLDPGGFVRWTPSARIRTLAFYGEHAEYDVVFPTNAQGFIDDVEYDDVDPARHNIAVIGDSFTAGFHGGEAWVPTLRQADGFDPRRHALFNGGVSGTGFASFAKLLGAMHDAWQLDEVLIVAIGDDFGRAEWRPVQDGERVVMCAPRIDEATCRTMGTRTFTFPRSATPEELGALVDRLQAGDASLWARFKARSFLLGLLRRLRNISTRDEAPSGNAVKEIGRAFPDTRIVVLQIPEKREAQSGEFHSRRAETEAAGLVYVNGWERCGLEPGDYLEYDSHANAAGYTKIRACALEALGLHAAR